MKRLILLVALAIGLVACGTVGETVSMTPTMACLDKAKSGPAATQRQAVNECMWAKALDLKD